MFIICKYKQSINSKTSRFSYQAWHSMKMLDVKVVRFKLKKTINISYIFKRSYYTNKSYIIHNEENIHNSFFSILNDKSRGGRLLSELILHFHKENRLNIPLFLTPLGIKASHDLINKIYVLPFDKKSKFRGDNLLFDFFNTQLKPIIRYNMKSSLTTIIPIKSYNIPILYQKLDNADCSGIYIFFHKTGNIGLGSALSCRDRLQDHINSFYGNRAKTFIHRWILNNGGIKSVKWAPNITYVNVVQEWYNYNFDSTLSFAGTNILQGFGQSSVRLF